jgi:DNA-binding transcriptional regulator GbsR (MarR family)
MEFFRAEKDISKVARCIARERRKREIEPVISLMAELSNAKLGSSDDAKEFTKVSKDIHEFSSTIDGFLDKFSRSDENWFYALMLKLMK